MLCFSVRPDQPPRSPLPPHRQKQTTTNSTPPRTPQVDSKDSLENVESKWVGEIAENCQGVKLVLVALKCDLRENSAEDDDEMGENGTERREKEIIDYKQGLEVARRIQALRYLGRANPASLS